MSNIIRMAGIFLFFSVVMAGCQTAGKKMTVSGLEKDATALTRYEIYNYLKEKTQVRVNGGVFYTEFGTIEVLADKKRENGTFVTYDGGKLCQQFKGREEGPCETYYHNDGGISIVSDGKTMPAPKLLAGNKLGFIETGVDRNMFTKEETTSLVSGKTANWTKGNGCYYNPNGELTSLWDGEKEVGTWSVTDKGAICWLIPSWGEVPCVSYYQGKDGLRAIEAGKNREAYEHLEGNALDSLKK